MKICFVCHANICRSFCAQELLKALCAKNNRTDIQVISRGIYAQSGFAVPQKIKDFLAQNQIMLPVHTATLLGKQDLETCDLILTMTADQWDFITDRYAQYTDKVHLFMDYAQGVYKDSEDPIGKTGRDFDKTMQKLKDAVLQVYLKLTK